MKIKSIAIHNFRSIEDIKFNLSHYSLLVGANNSGKTNILTALRIFYEDNIQFNKENDFPKFSTKDDESWIDIEYQLSPKEYAELRREYHGPYNTLKVRKYLWSKDRVKTGQSNLYGFINGSSISTEIFYDSKTVSQSRLGRVIYIPATAETSETMKLSGPSPLRNMISFVVEKIIEESSAFTSLTQAFEVFNSEFVKEESEDGFSINNLKNDVNDNLSDWNVRFNLSINPLKPDEIIKNLIAQSFSDTNLNKEILLTNTGQGLQRHLIYTLLRLQSTYIEKQKRKLKEFSPELTLLLFEEPEAYLHPCQQECQNRSLKLLAIEENQQILISTHSPVFVSKNIEDLPAIIRIQKRSHNTEVFQVNDETKNALTKENNELAQYLKNKLSDATVSDEAKAAIRRCLGKTPEAQVMEEEAIRYLLWLDSNRCSAFFADIVLICEGATEKTLIDYLVENEWNESRFKKVYILDAMGKYSIHRYMNLFKGLGIRHSVLYDKDLNQDFQQLINQFLNDQKNAYTAKIYGFDTDIEGFLSVPLPERSDKKPLNIMWHYLNGKIEKKKIEDLRVILESLL